MLPPWNPLYYSLSLMNVTIKRVTSVRSKAGKAKQPLEPAWPATNMAAAKHFMSRVLSLLGCCVKSKAQTLIM